VISFSQVKLAYGDRVLFEDADFLVRPGDRIGLVGPNGAGKTTVFKLLAGLEEPDSGQVSVDPGIVVGYFSQDVGEMRGRSALAEVISGAGRVYELKLKLEAFEHRMSTPDAEPLSDAEMENYGEAQLEFQQLSGYELETNAQTILSGLGIARGQHTVELARGRATCDQILGGHELRVHDLLESLDGLRPHERDPVDAKHGCTRDPELRGQRQILVDLGHLPASGGLGLELAPIDASHHGPTQVVFRRELSLVGKNQIVKPPEGIGAAEGKHRHGRLRGWSGIAVEGQRIILPHQAKLGRTVVLSQGFERLTHASAERALKVAELDDGDRRFQVAPGRILGRDRHHAAGRWHRCDRGFLCLVLCILARTGAITGRCTCASGLS